MIAWAFLILSLFQWTAVSAAPSSLIERQQLDLGLCDKAGPYLKQTGTDCTQYGDPPRPVVNNLVSPTGLQDFISICRGEIVTITDNLGVQRKACFYANPASTKAKPLPLLVWLHPSLASASVAFPLTGIDAARNKQSLNNEDSSALGFSYLLPYGRNTEHFYPVPDNVGIGWDNWYRNLDRSSSSLNSDVDFIDKAIAYAKGKAPVDERRVFMSGWSNGAAMAMLYGLNTDKIASVAVYSSPDPYRDSADPCTQVPYPKFATPTLDVHSQCDIIGICTTGRYFWSDLKARYPRLAQSFVVIDDLTTAVIGRDANSKCNPLCARNCIIGAGTVNHLRWPIARNTDTFFAHFRANPLPKSLSWGRP